LARNRGETPFCVVASTPPSGFCLMFFFPTPRPRIKITQCVHCPCHRRFSSFSVCPSQRKFVSFQRQE
jgi:hypothetical protein